MYYKMHFAIMPIKLNYISLTFVLKLKGHLNVRVWLVTFGPNRT